MNLRPTAIFAGIWEFVGALAWESRRKKTVTPLTRQESLDADTVCDFAGCQERHPPRKTTHKKTIVKLSREHGRQNNVCVYL